MTIIRITGPDCAVVMYYLINTHTHHVDLLKIPQMDATYLKSLTVPKWPRSTINTTILL